MSILKLKLKRIDPVKWGVIVGALYALLSLIIVVPMFFIFSIAGAANGFGDSGADSIGLFGGGIAMLFMPILYGILGFIFGLIGALLLNFILKKTKGLEMDFEKAGLEIDEMGQRSF